MRYPRHLRDFDRPLKAREMDDRHGAAERNRSFRNHWQSCRNEKRAWQGMLEAAADEQARSQRTFDPFVEKVGPHQLRIPRDVGDAARRLNRSRPRLLLTYVAGEIPGQL